MFFNTRIKWTIDLGRSEIFFRIKYIALTGLNDIIDNINSKPHCNEFNTGEFFSNELFPGASYNGYRTRREPCIIVEEFPPTVNYDLVIFEDKNHKQFWKRRTFSGLLIFKNTGKITLITLQHITNTFDNCGRVAATYSVMGEVNKKDFDLGRGSIETEGEIVLDSELLFEGTIRLVQEE
jgi:hypothetical protein